MPLLNGFVAIDELGLDTPFAGGSEAEDRTELRLLEALGETPFAAEAEGNAADALEGFGARFGRAETGDAWPEAAYAEASPAGEAPYIGEGEAPDMAALQGLLENETDAAPGVGERITGVAAFVLGPTLRAGSSGPAVTALQRYLTQLGFGARADGNFGPGTERALRGFQTRSGISADGVAGPRTKAAIAAALGRTGLSVAPAPAPSASPNGGRLVVAQHPVLRAHRGTSPDLILKWTGIHGPGAVDVAVHFHGYSGHKGGMRLDRHKEPHSGLDFSDPASPGAPGRTEPTLAILPRGNYFGGKSGAGYNFPALIRPGALHALVQDALARAGQAIGHNLQIGRLILTGHSGGGAPIAAILAHTDPDEVHIFDGTYGSGANIVRWAQRRIGHEVVAPSARPPAMRILYRPGTQTASHAEAIARDVCKSLQTGTAAPLRSRFRVDATPVGHNEIPRRFGWRLLANPAADLPDARPRACAGAVSGESFVAGEEPEASPFWQARPTDREESQQEAIAMTERQYFGADEGYYVNEDALYEHSSGEELAWLDLETENAAGEWFEPETQSDLLAPAADWSESLAHESESDAEPRHEWLEAEQDETESDNERFGELDSESDAEWDESEERDEQLFRFEQSWESTAEGAEHGIQPEAEGGLAASGLSTAERKAVEITSTLETGKRGGFYGLSGNFDGQGLSFGLVNWTIGTGSLQPLLRDFAAEHPQRWNAVFDSDAARFLTLITPKGDAARKEQHRFAIEEMNTSSVRNGKRVWLIREPWVTYFKRLSEDSEFRKVQVRYVRHLLARAEYFCKHFSLKSEAAFAFMFDAVASHGKWWLTKKIRGRRRRQLLLRDRLKALAQQHNKGQIPEREKLLAIADILGATSAPRWAAKVRQRKRWFVTGEHPRARELRGLEPRLDVPYSTSPAPAKLDEAFEPVEAAHEDEQFTSEMTVLENLLEAEAGAGTGLAARAKGVAVFVLGPTLQRGSVGPGVATLQRCLAQLGHQVTADGNFGLRTEQAVRAFQSRSGLTPDGVVGPRTKAAIAAAVGAGAAPSPAPIPVPIPFLSSLGDTIARVAEQEYRRWHTATGKLRETDSAAAPILQQYYREGVNRNVSAAELQDTSWQRQHPWSAVFVSFVMRTSGAGSAFKYSAAHQSYIAAARRNRLQAVASSPFWAYRATEVAPQVGDLVCASRADSGATYDNIGDARSRATHCDIVTEVRPGSLRVIGGNVNQNVDAKIIKTRPDGRLALDGKQARFFAVLRCRGAASGAARPQPPAQVDMLDETDEDETFYEAYEDTSELLSEKEEPDEATGKALYSEVSFNSKNQPAGKEPGFSEEVSRSSPEYVRWVQQSLNRILGARLAVDGAPGPRTRDAVRRFQTTTGLKADGIVGPKTENALAAAGAVPRPTGPGMSGSARTAAASPTAPAIARVPRSTQWVRDAWAGHKCADGRMRRVRILGWNTPVNALTVDAFKALDRALRTSGYQAERAWNYVCRKVRGTERMSLHAYGLAVDIDPPANPHRKGQAGPARFSAAPTKQERFRDVRQGTADTVLTRDQVAAVEGIKTTEGIQIFNWGGRWRKNPDAMHFQINVSPGELNRGIAQQA